MCEGAAVAVALDTSPTPGYDPRSSPGSPNMTRHVLGLAAVVCASLASTGCTTDGEWSVRRVLGWEDPKPRAMKWPSASLEVSERVETLGRKIVAQNTFTGIEPLFHTGHVPDAVLFHRGSEELWISEGLVNQCKTEVELAAVLCSELGQMIAEKKVARRAGADRDSFPEVGVPTGSGLAGGAFDDPARAAERAYL